jgi:hypothetical protein
MIDGGGSGRDKNDDMRIDVFEWLAGFKNVIDHGFVGLQFVTSKAEALEVFKMIDGNGGGLILLDEWCSFLKNCEVAADSPIGRLLVAEQIGQERRPKTNKLRPPDPVDDEVRKLMSTVAKKQRPSCWAADRTAALNPTDFLKRRTRGDELQLASGQPSIEQKIDELKLWLQNKACYDISAEMNSFGMAVGETVSNELKNFISVFEPLGADTPEGEALRSEGFLAADPNGKKHLKVTYLHFINTA